MTAEQEQVFASVEGVDFDGPYKMTLLQRNSMLVFEIVGKLTGVLPGQFIAEIHARSLGMSPPHLVFDLTRCAYLSSTALGDLVHLLSYLRGHDGHILALRPNQRILSLLEVLGLSHLMHVIADEAVAQSRLESLG